MVHAAEVAFTFLPYVGGEEDGAGRIDAGVTKGGGDGEERGEAGSVVADSGAVDARGVRALDWLAVSAVREDGVEVGGDKDDLIFWNGAFGCEFGEGVALFVEVEVGEAEVMEALKEPCGAVLLVKGRCGDSDEVEEPAAQLRLMEVQPVESAVSCGQGRKFDDALVGRG
jgi:hypothetical protein